MVVASATVGTANSNDDNNSANDRSLLKISLYSSPPSLAYKTPQSYFHSKLSRSHTDMQGVRSYDIAIV